MEPLTCSVADACAMTGIGVTTCYALMAEGKLETVKVGRRRLIKIASLRKLVGANQPEAQAA